MQYKRLYEEAKTEITSLRIQLAETREKLDQATHSGDYTLVDLGGIADHCDVDRLTPQQWRQRKILPPVDYPQIQHPLWHLKTIRNFAEATGRPWIEHPKGHSTSKVLTPAFHQAA